MKLKRVGGRGSGVGADALPAPTPDPRPPTPAFIDAPDGLASVAVTGEHDRLALVREPMHVVVRRVALPAVASNLLMTLFGSVDAFWVGTRLGAGSLAAVTTSLFWIWLFVSVAEMVSVGLTAVAARRHGERRPAEAARVAGDALLYALALGSAIAVGGTHWLPSLFTAMHAPESVASLGRSYLGTYLLGAPLIFGYFAVDATFRASGDTRTPLLLLAASVAVTLVLDPVLILGLGGAPRLGIVGAAIATVGTRCVAFLLGVALLARRRMLRVGVPRLPSIAAVTRVGLPTALTGVLFSAIYVVLTRTTTRFGTPALAALGLGFRVESWLYMVGVGFGAAAAAIVGQNLGAGRPDRAERAGWITTAYATVPGVLAFALELLVPERLAAIFSLDAAVIAETARYLRIAAFAQLVVCAEVVLEGALGGAGDTVPPMLTSSVLTASRIPLAAWAANRYGTVGLWWTISLTATARGLAMMALWKSGRWKRRRV
ncbi:MAG TPA: MATE family efflux transporter [Gemmatimonadaceae bacterium]|nr:MATE family efflux transporter [Gemmatimonadaceae bacterium]